MLSPGVAVAQELGSAQQAFTVSVDPSTPAARSSITITPVSGDIDIAAATMTISVNGTQVYSGAAVPTAVTTLKAGQVMNILVSMKTALGTYKQAFGLTPEDVTIVAEPLSSAPLLYPGKPLVPLGGSVRIVAVADLHTAGGGQIDPSTLAYTWIVDGDEAVDASGIGKRTIIVDSPLQYRSRTVQVSASSPDGSLVGTASLDLESAEPIMRIYVRDPLMGIRFDRALGSDYTLSGSEATFYGVPFSFPLALGAPTLSWYVEGRLSQTGNLVTLRPTGTGTGTASVSLTGASRGSLDAPAASVSLTVSYGNEGGGGLFGL